MGNCLRSTRAITLAYRRNAGSANESATAGPGATLRGNVTGKDVYLVLSGPGKVDVRVDGKPEKTVEVTTQKLYHLLSRPKAASHDLQLTFTPGVSAFAFTFG